MQCASIQIAITILLVCWTTQADFVIATVNAITVTIVVAVIDGAVVAILIWRIWR